METTIVHSETKPSLILTVATEWNTGETGDMYNSVSSPGAFVQQTHITVWLHWCYGKIEFSPVVEIDANNGKNLLQETTHIRLALGHVWLLIQLVTSDDEKDKQGMAQNGYMPFHICA